jgi:hypothetical protein
VRLGQGREKILHHLVERQIERGTPADQHVVTTGRQSFRGRSPHNIAKAAAHAVTFHRAADLPGHRETDPRRPLIAALARLQDERRPGYLRPRRSGNKVCALSQALHRSEAGPAALRSRAEPLAAPRATRIDDFATTFRRHAGAKTVSALAHQFTGLIGPLHGSRLRFSRSSGHADARASAALRRSNLSQIARLEKFCGLYGRGLSSSM